MARMQNKKIERWAILSLLVFAAQTEHSLKEPFSAVMLLLLALLYAVEMVLMTYKQKLLRKSTEDRKEYGRPSASDLDAIASEERARQATAENLDL